MHLTLLLNDEADLPATNKRMPLLRDALLTEMHSLFSLRLVRNAGFESGLVKERLLEICESQLGKGVVGDLMMREVERRQPNQT